MTTPGTTDLLLKAMRHEAEDILSFEFTAPQGGELPAFTAGAHLDVHLGQNLVRSYSLANAPAERHRYVLAVRLDATGRGGSRQMHEKLRVGQRVAVGAPRNLFPLDESAERSVLIAGGIGITPVWSMAQRLEALGRPWTLHYCARSRAHAAFIDAMEAMVATSTVGKLVLDFDDQRGAPAPDLQRIVAEAGANAHLYCCGPQPMLDAFRQATAALPAAQVHLESFGAAPPPACASESFELVLSRSGRRIEVQPGKTMLDALLDAGESPMYGCMQGVCGMCEVAVLEGEPEHRDMILGDDVKASNRAVILCCSGSRSRELVLDL
jgi:ferredoxin-NADP reductase